ncbi:hypothetical protein BaRGS_00009050 [Batillaria attramentaria]|uniref:ATP-grasp domain-containing protein n=1 Tax=Batillaria attramentaria TaxID=370345 RepID=A0ABD0LJL7_9CAEN
MASSRRDAECDDDADCVDGPLHSALTDLGLPPFIDRTDTPSRHVTPGVTIVIMAELGEALTPFFEGNRQCPGAVLLVLSPSWLSRHHSPTDVAMETLYVLKAITADAAGQTYFDVFTPPRRVTYVINHMTRSSNDAFRNKAQQLTAFGLDTPIGNSLPLSLRLDDSLLTRTLCAAVGVEHPKTLGFVLAGESGAEFPTVTVVRLASKNVDDTKVEQFVRTFVESEGMNKCEEVSVALCSPGSKSFGGKTFHKVDDVSAIVASVLNLLVDLEPGSAVLVEAVVMTFDPTVPANVGLPLECRLTAIVSRTPQDGAWLSQITCVMSAFNNENNIPTSLELLLRKWGVRDVAQVHDAIKRGSEALVLELLARERKLSAEERGGVGALTDLIGVDYVITKINDVITPVVTQVRGVGSLQNSAVYELINPVFRGQASRTWFQTMVARSQRFLMKGKTVLVVGAGSFSKRNLWKDARAYGVKIVVVGACPKHFAQELVHTYLHYDMSDHARDTEHAAAIVKLVQSKVGHVDGCLAFLHDCVPLASLVAKGLKLRHTPSYAAALAANKKGLTLKTLNEDNSVFACFPALRPVHFSSPVARVRGPDDLDKAVRKVPFPAVMKIEFGSGGVGVKHVRNVEEARDFAQYVQNNLRSDEDYPRVGLSHADGHCLAMMPRLMGTEHNVDVVMFDGHLMAAFVTDHGPTHVPLCQQTAAAMPTMLSPEAERELIAGVAACCRGVGLKTGVFNVEMMMTPRGPRLIEINARIGGYYTREWIRRFYDVDMLLMALMAACGVRPVATNSPLGGYSNDKVRKDHGQLIGIMVYPTRHEEALATTATPEYMQRLHDKGVIFFTQNEPQVEKGDQDFEEPYANLAVHAPTLEQARAKLLGTCQALGLESEESMAYILQDFIHA